MHPGLKIPLDKDRLVAFCLRWGVRELSVFGSVLRDDFRPDSDVDVLVEYHPGTGPSFETFPQMLEELRALFGRSVDLVEKDHIRGSIRRNAILASHRVVYAA